MSHVWRVREVVSALISVFVQSEGWGFRILSGL